MPPQSLVVGDGAYSRALAMVLGAAFLTPEQIFPGPAPYESGAFPRVLGALERVFLVAGNGHGAADILRLHEAAWDWVAGAVAAVAREATPTVRAATAGLGLRIPGAAAWPPSNPSF